MLDVTIYLHGDSNEFADTVHVLRGMEDRGVSSVGYDLFHDASLQWKPIHFECLDDTSLNHVESYLATLAIPFRYTVN